MIMKLVFGLILAACLTSAHAQVYKWVDAEGKTHYSDRAAPADAIIVPEKMNTFSFHDVLSKMHRENHTRNRMIDMQAAPPPIVPGVPAPVAEVDEGTVKHLKRPPPIVITPPPAPGTIVKSGNTWTVQ